MVYHSTHSLDDQLVNAIQNSRVRVKLTILELTKETMPALLGDTYPSKVPVIIYLISFLSLNKLFPFFQPSLIVTEDLFEY